MIFCTGQETVLGHVEHSVEKKKCAVVHTVMKLENSAEAWYSVDKTTDCRSVSKFANSVTLRLFHIAAITT